MICMIFKNIYFWLCCIFVASQAFSSCSEWGLLFIAGYRLLIAVASLVVEHAVQGAGTSAVVHSGSVVASQGLSCSVGMWDLPRPEIKPMFPPLAGEFFTSEPPGKPLPSLLIVHLFTQNCSNLMINDSIIRITDNIYSALTIIYQESL